MNALDLWIMKPNHLRTKKTVVWKTLVSFPLSRNWWALYTTVITWSTFGKQENSSLMKNFVCTSWKSILKLGNLRIFSRISQKHRLQRPLTLVTLAWFSILEDLTVVKSFLKHLRAQFACYELKRDLSPVMLKEISHDEVAKLQGFVCKTMQAWLDGKSFFSHTNASNFKRPLQSLLLRYAAENSQVT